MSETYRIVSQPEGEPLPAGRVGICVRVSLSGYPSKRWSRALSSHLVNQLTGQPAVGHIRLDSIIHADQIVLEGVEAREAPHLGCALQRAVDGANDTCARAEARDEAAQNVSSREATAIARRIRPGG